MKSGDWVEFHGLKGAAHLNGKKGYLTKFNTKEQRWGVRCDGGGKIVQAKPGNLQLATRAATEDRALHEMLDRARAAGSHSSPPEMKTSSGHDDALTLNEAVLDAYYLRRKGGAVVFHSDQYMLAVELFGPHGARCAEVEMVYVGQDRAAQALMRQCRCASAKELGRDFLAGETVEYFEATGERAFFDLLDRYTRSARSKGGLIDMKSGLKIYEGTIS